MNTEKTAAGKQAEEALDILYEMSQLMNTNLDKTQLSILVALSESGVSPQALAEIVKELRSEELL